jgi:hypothetical protein
LAPFFSGNSDLSNLAVDEDVFNEIAKKFVHLLIHT